MLDFFNNWSTDQLESLRAMCNVSLMVCTAAVVIGVLFEKEGYPENVRNEGWRLVVKGVLGELLFAVAIFQLDTSIGVRQKAEIAALNALVAPRRLSAGDIAALKAAVRPFADRQISVWSYGIDLEARLLATQILDALNDVRVPTVDSIGHMLSSTVPRIGVIVTGPDEALIGALLVALKPVSAEHGPTLTAAQAATAVPAEIFVGIKPIAK